MNADALWSLAAGLILRGTWEQEIGILQGIRDNGGIMAGLVQFRTQVLVELRGSPTKRVGGTDDEYFKRVPDTV